MSSILDIMGALIIGGVLMLVTSKALDNGVREFVNHNADAIIQAELSTMTRIVQDNLRKVGYGIAEAYQASIVQDIGADRFVYLARINPESPVADTVEFIVLPADSVIFIDASMIFNGLYRIDRVYEAAPETTYIGRITNSDVFRYLDQAGRETDVRQAVRMVEVTLVAINPNIYLDDQVLTAPTALLRKKELKNLTRESFWRQTRVVSRNLRR